MQKRPLVFVVAVVVLLALFMPVREGPLDLLIGDSAEAGITGNIIAIKETEKNFCLSLDQVWITWKGKRIPVHKVLLYLHRENEKEPPTNLQPGFCIEAKGDLMKWKQPGNPGEFDAYSYYKRKGYDYSFMADRAAIVDTKRNLVSRLRACLFSFQTRLSEVCQKVYPQKQAGLIQEMFLGEKGRAEEESKELFRRNGIGHLICISGLHLSLIGMGIYRLGIRVLRHKKAACLCGMAASFLYGLMTGLETSASRAVLMLWISFFSVLVGRSYDMISAASLSAVILLSLHPLEIRDGGFLLSFGAVIGIAAVSPILLKGRRRDGKEQTGKKDFSYFLKKVTDTLWETLILSVSIQLVTLPVLLNNYYEYPLYSIFLNVLVLPLMSLLAALSMLSCLVGLFSLHMAVFLGGSVSFLLSLYDFLCQGFDRLPGSHIVTGEPQPLFFVLYYGVLIVTMAVFSRSEKKQCLFLLCLIFLIPIRPRIKGIRITMLDVGQGDGIYVETEEGFRAFVDGGSSSQNKLGTYVLAPFLKSQGADSLDAVFLSHLDEDHCNGMFELLENPGKFGVSIHQFILSQAASEEEAFLPWKRELMKNRIPCKIWNAGDGMETRDGRFFLLCHYPGAENPEKDRNENSMVFSLLYDDFSMLFTGDIGSREMDAAARIAECPKKPRAYTILKVGHHGSKNSSSLSFLKAIRPFAALISAGDHNRYGHPHNETLQRLAECHSRVYQTKEGGAVTISYQNHKIKLAYFRASGYNK